MTFLEAVESNKWFRLKGTKNWLKVNTYGEIVIAQGENEGNVVNLIKKDILGDYEVKEEWYKNLKEKYPNGVWCWVWNKKGYEMKAVITNYYKKKDSHPFVTTSGWCYEHAEPLTEEEAKEVAPAVIGKEV